MIEGVIFVDHALFFMCKFDVGEVLLFLLSMKPVKTA